MPVLKLGRHYWNCDKAKNITEAKTWKHNLLASGAPLVVKIHKRGYRKKILYVCIRGIRVKK